MIEKIRVRISFWEDGQEYGFEDPASDMSQIPNVVAFILEILKKDYNARHKGENSLWQ